MRLYFVVSSLSYGHGFIAENAMQHDPDDRRQVSVAV